MTSKPLGILAADPFGPSMAGPARRSLALARHLGDVAPIDLWYEGDAPDPIPNVTFHPFILENWLKASERYAAALIPSQFALKEHRVFDAPCIRIIDCTVPFPLETASILIGAPVEEAKQITRLQSWAINRAVSAGDYWLVSNNEQQNWLMGMLTSLGRMTASLAAEYGIGSRIIQAPYGMEKPPVAAPDSAPRHALLSSLGLKSDARYLLWTGGLWPWMDPVMVIEAMPSILELHPELHLLLPGATSLNAASPGRPLVQAVHDRIAQLNLATHVHPLPWIAVADWPAIASGARLHVSAHHVHPEADVSFRTRYLESLRYRRLLVATFIDPLGDQLERIGCATLVFPNNPAMYADGVLKALEIVDDDNGEWEQIDQYFAWETALSDLEFVIENHLTPHPDGPWTPEMAGNPAAAPPTPTLLDRAMNKLRRMTR